MANAEVLTDDSVDVSAMLKQFIHGSTGRAIAMRLLLLLCAGGVSANWVGWGWAALWIVGVAVNETALARAILRYVVTPLFERNAVAAANAVLAALCLFATLLVMSLWVSAWMLAGAEFAPIAMLCVAAMLIYANTYLTSDWLYWPGFVPPVLAGLIVPLFAPHASGANIWVTPLAVAFLGAMAPLSRAHSWLLTGAMRELETGFQQAADASGAKSQFLATMSHELRTPLNAVIGYAEMLEETLDEGGRAAEASDARRIGRAGRTLLGLINEILDFSKIEAGKMELVVGPVHLAEVVADVVQTCNHIADKNGSELAVNLDVGSGLVLADGGKLRQCLLNLVSNACKFTENGRIAINVRLNHGELEFVVADNGCGISEEAAAKLFQPFVQAGGSTPRKHAGTGLGLVIAQRLARLMGGDITMTSVLGEGSTFVLTAKVQEAPHAIERAPNLGIAA